MRVASQPMQEAYRRIFLRAGEGHLRPKALIREKENVEKRL
jgi:hypothetical protein